MRHPSFLSALGLLACLGSSGVARAERLRFDCGNPTVPLYRSVVGVGATEDAAFKDAELKIGLSYCAKGTDCTPVRATFKRYGIDDSDGRRVCARMVALTDELLRAKEGVSSIKPLLQQLRISAQELSTSLMIRRLSPRVVLASIRDLGSYYGDRVERFRAWIEAALTETPGVEVQTPRYDVRGQLIVPTGQSRLSANVVERVEGGIAVVEIQLHVDLPTARGVDHLSHSCLLAQSIAKARASADCAWEAAASASLAERVAEDSDCSACRLEASARSRFRWASSRNR